MKCPKCQTENIENSRFCNQCATSLVPVVDKSPEGPADKLRKTAAYESPEILEDQPAEAVKAKSPFARVFDKSEVAETLRLIRKDSSSHIDEELGLSICRFAGVRALILPSL